MGEDTTQRFSVLVIEDDFDVQQSLAQVLMDEGYVVETAVDGAEALARLQARQEQPSVMILDLWMPRMNGFEFRKAQLASPETADIPVVVVTAGGVAPNEMAALGLTYVLPKPVDLEILLRVVRRLASSARRGPSPSHAGV